MISLSVCQIVLILQKNISAALQHLSAGFVSCHALRSERWRAISGEKIALHRMGFPAILPRRVAGDVGDRQRTSINDVEHDKHAQLTLVWIEASECLYPDMRKGAC